jgi:hypothetical protein
MLLVPLAIFLSLFLLAGSASAVLVELQDEATSWTAGETLNFVFDSSEVLPSDGTAGSLFIEARGDFFNKTPLNYPNDPEKWELIDIQVDVYTIAEDFYLTLPVVPVGTPGITVWDPKNDHNEWNWTWSIDPAYMLEIAADQAADIVIALHMGVRGARDGDFVKANLSYNAVPIPGALWLLGGGLIGLVGIRRKTMG